MRLERGDQWPLTLLRWLALLLGAAGIFLGSLGIAEGQIIKHPPAGTVADLPTCNAARDATLRGVTDGADSTDCTTGGGTDAVTCRCDNGTGWVVVGGGSGHGDGANCAAGEIPLGVDANGAAQGCYEPTEADISDLAHTTDASLLSSGTIAAARVGADHIDAITEIASGVRSGADTTLITGTAGADTECAQWNADGDLVTSGGACGGGGGGAAISLDYDGDATDEVVSDGTTIDFDPDDDGTAEVVFSGTNAVTFYPGGGRASVTATGEFSDARMTLSEQFGSGASCSSSQCTVVGNGAGGGNSSVGVGYLSGPASTGSVCIGRQCSVNASSTYGQAYGRLASIPSAGMVGWIHMGSPSATCSGSICRFHLGPAITSASPQDAGVFGVQGSGTDALGGNLYLQGGASTGAGASSSTIIRVSPAGGSGSSLNAYADALTVDGDGVTVNRGSLKTTCQSTPPETCDSGAKGGQYCDSDLTVPCWCNGTNWVQMDDWSTTCS